MSKSFKRIFAAAALISSLAAIALFAPWRGGGAMKADFLPGSLRVDGLRRNYVVHLPASYDKSNTYPLVIGLHGRMGNGRGQARLSGMNELADQENFIVAYPDGYKAVKRGWADGRGKIEARGREIDDVKFIGALIDKLSADYSVDLSRVYACGMSNGGFMSMRLACDLSNRITAVAAVGAVFGEQLAERCEPERPVPVMIITGTADPLVKYEGGVIEQSDFKGRYLSAEGSLARWAEIDGCKSGPNSSRLKDSADDGTSVTEISYGDCDMGVKVELYKVENGGHTWPGGEQYLPESIIGPTSRDIDASETIWKFFEGYKIQRR